MSHARMKELFKFFICIVKEGSKDPRVLGFLQGLQQKHKGDSQAIVKEIIAFVASIPAYKATFDPEVFSSPGHVLDRIGSPQSCVDGDERAALLASLLKAGGHDVTFVARSYRPHKHFSHVFVRIRDENGNWRPAIPQETPPPTAEESVTIKADDLQPCKVDSPRWPLASGLEALKESEAMSDEQDTKVVRVVADAEWLVKQVVQQHEKLFILLLNAKGETIANIPIDSINGDVGEELQTLRGWLSEQLEGAFKAGMESREENVLRDWSSDLTELEKEVARLKDENERLFQQGIEQERKRWEDALRSEYHWHLKMAGDAHKQVEHHENRSEALYAVLKAMDCVPKMPGSESGK